MHRGGTSLVARAVNALGVELGDKLHSPSVTENPTGFWEDEDILDINERVLASIGASWHSLVLPPVESWRSFPVQGLKNEAATLLTERLSRYGSWGFKDPRTVRLLPFWKDVFIDLAVSPLYVIAARDPVSVAQSLERRNGLLATRSHILWLGHMLCALRDTEDARRVFVDYDSMVEETATQLQRLAGHLGIEVTKEVGVRISEFADGFVSLELRHHRSASSSLSTAQVLPVPVRRLHSVVQDLATDKAPPRHETLSVLKEVSEVLDEWRPLCEYIDRTDQFPELSKRLNQLGADHAHAQEVVRERDAQLKDANNQLSRLGQEHAHAQSVVRERDSQLAALNIQLTQLGKEHVHAQGVVRERDAQLREVNARLAQLAEEHTRLQSIANEQASELKRITTHWLWRAARFIFR
jgi:hypothetical protein